MLTFVILKFIILKFVYYTTSLLKTIIICIYTLKTVILIGPANFYLELK